MWQQGSIGAQLKSGRGETHILSEDDVNGNLTAVFEVENEISARIRLWFAKAGPKIVVRSFGISEALLAVGNNKLTASIDTSVGTAL